MGGGTVITSPLINQLLEADGGSLGKIFPKERPKKKITYYEAPQTFWNRPFSPPSKKKWLFCKDDLVIVFVGPQKTKIPSNLSALALKALMDFASTCTCLRMRQRSCGGGRRNVEQRPMKILFKRSLHNRKKGAYEGGVVESRIFELIPFTPSRHSQFPSSNFKGCILLYLFFFGACVFFKFCRFSISKRRRF